MGLEYAFKMDVLPEFVTIAQFYISEPPFQILFEGMKIGVPIVGKIICKTIITSVTITKNYKF